MYCYKTIIPFWENGIETYPGFITMVPTYKTSKIYIFSDSKQNENTPFDAGPTFY